MVPAKKGLSLGLGSHGQELPATEQLAVTTAVSLW
jgi:hypothetical protein